ncbi:uncharacterized protein O3C94_006042 isoform 2-T2 [Discoglossus pictus]
MRPLVLTRYCSLILLALAALTDLGEAESPNDKKSRNSTQVVVTKRRGHASQPLRSGQRGRKKSIWSYKPGHRSLAFLVAGDVVTSPPVDLGPDSEHRCIGCCEEGGANFDERITDPTIDNKVDESLLRTQSLDGIVAEPNSVTDRCLGCCVETPTPTMRGAAELKTPEARRQVEKQTTNRQPLWPALVERDQDPPCGKRDCGLDWSSESDSSSEEAGMRRGTRTMMESRRRSQLPPLQHHTGHRCRHLGCRSALGSNVDSSSEED